MTMSSLTASEGGGEADEEEGEEDDDDRTVRETEAVERYGVEEEGRRA